LVVAFGSGRRRLRWVVAYRPIREPRRCVGV